MGANNDGRNQAACIQKQTGKNIRLYARKYTYIYTYTKSTQTTTDTVGDGRSIIIYTLTNRRVLHLFIHIAATSYPVFLSFPRVLLDNIGLCRLSCPLTNESHSNTYLLSHFQAHRTSMKRAMLFLFFFLYIIYLYLYLSLGVSLFLTRLLIRNFIRMYRRHRSSQPFAYTL
jgi:hypothetical protein